MKKQLLMICCGLTLLTGPFTASVAADQAKAPAAATAMPNPACNCLKIGVVDVRQVLQKAPEMATVNKQLEEQFKPRESKIVEAQQTVKAEEDKMSRDSAVMSDGDRAQLQNKMVADKANLQAMITSFQQDLNSAQNQQMQKMLNQVATIVNGIAKNEKFDLILQGENVPFVNATLNITDKVLAALSKTKA